MAPSELGNRLHLYLDDAGRVFGGVQEQFASGARPCGWQAFTLAGVTWWHELEDAKEAVDGRVRS